METLYPAPYQGDQDDNELETLAKYLISLKDEKILDVSKSAFGGGRWLFHRECS
jgi:hypothetical protein